MHQSLKETRNFHFRFLNNNFRLKVSQITAVSIETAFRQAKKQGHPLTTELIWLAVHGFLHLLGWDHPDEESWYKMVKQQLFLLNAVGITIGEHIS